MLRCFDSSGTHLLHLLPLLVLLWPASAAPTPHVALSAPAGASVRPAARKAPVATLGADPSSDRVELVGGTTHGGRVLYEDDEVVILKQDEHVRTFVRDKVRRVDTRETRLGEVLDRMASLEDHEFPELIELGHRAHELGLPGEGELVFLRILLTDPFNEEARHALGHKRVGKAWRVPYKDDWLPLSKVRKLREEWNDGWVFETEQGRPTSPRGAVQRDAEDVVLEHGRRNDIPTLVLRLGGLYGPGRDLGRVYRRRREAPLPGSGNAPTNLIHVDDAVAASLSALAAPAHIGGIVHVVDDDHRSRRAMYDAVAQARGLDPVAWEAAVGPEPPAGKRVSNARLKLDLGVRLKHPTHG